MIVDVLLASVPSASTLPGASIELGQHAWGLAMSEWLDKAGQVVGAIAKFMLHWPLWPDRHSIGESLLLFIHSTHKGNKHCKQRDDSCKHFQYWLILPNKTFLLICDACPAPTMSYDSTAGWGTLLYISCCVSAFFSLPCFMVMRFTEVSNTALGIFPSPSSGQKIPMLGQLQM